ncbi:MAG: NADP oxidoreductase [Myxococcales bacterium]|nr:MAG: NADP oxidoreductase [Myxococcales bacterium]
MSRRDTSFGVIGPGAMGRVFVRRLVERGHQVRIASSRPAESLRALAAELGAEAASTIEAVAASQIVFLAIPTKAVAALPPGLFAGATASTIVIDVGNYHPQLRDGRIEAIERGALDSEWVSQQLGFPVIKAFNSILAESLLAKSAPRGTRGRIALPVAGDSPEAVECVLRLVDELGFDPVAAGSSSESWRQQTGAPAYCADLDEGALKRALAEAERDRVADYRAERESYLRRLLEGSSGARPPTC